MMKESFWSMDRVHVSAVNYTDKCDQNRSSCQIVEIESYKWNGHGPFLIEKKKSTIKCKYEKLWLYSLGREREKKPKSISAQR